jgi:hypothetical protein
MKYIIPLAIAIALFLSCSKEEPINLTAACEKGDRWMVNTVDTFSGADTGETFFFVQGGGYHTMNWIRTPFNTLSLSVSQLPQVNETIYFKKAFVKNLICTYKGINYSYALQMDSTISLSHKGSYFELKVKDIVLSALGSPDIKFRACDLRMNDITP